MKGMQKNCAAFFSGPFHYLFLGKIAKANLLIKKILKPVLSGV
jgi:hypothetical protein